MKLPIHIPLLIASILAATGVHSQTQLAEKMRGDCLREAQQAPSWVLSEAYKAEQIGGFRFVYNLKVAGKFLSNPVRCYALITFENHLQEGQKNEISNYRKELVDVIERERIAVAEILDYRLPNQQSYGILSKRKDGGWTSYDEVIELMDKVMSSDR
jgi:hypothetical protein